MKRKRVWRVTSLTVAGALLAGTGAFAVKGAATRAGSTPLRGKIAFEGWPDEQEGAIFVASADGRHLRRETPFGAASPTWSPDGKRIAFAGILNSGPGSGGPYIYIKSIAGKRIRRIAVGGEPNWDPDGGRLVYSVGYFSSGKIATVGLAGRHKHVFRLGVQAVFPDWSPDGRRIVFAGYKKATGSPSDIYVVNADGTHVHRLTKTATATDESYEAHWSADGSKIFFVWSKDNDVSQAFYEMDPDGGRLRRLAQIPPPSALGGELRKGTSSWSVNGRIVMYCDGGGRIVALRIGQPKPRVVRMKRHLVCESLDWHTSR
ncbi:MAG: hypothetical protein M3R70_01375 [Actinomycetota bacterium]|nr:hypothetical protein [Actinomycetota bacterium]